MQDVEGCRRPPRTLQTRTSNFENSENHHVDRQGIDMEEASQPSYIGGSLLWFSVVLHLFVEVLSLFVAVLSISCGFLSLFFMKKLLIKSCT